MGGKDKKRSRVDYFEVLSMLYLLLIVLFILLVAGIGNHNIFVVLIGFFPAIVTVIISLLIHEQFANKNAYIWLIPIIVSIGFYLIGVSSSVFKDFDIEVLTGVNFIIALIYVMIVFMVFKKPKKELKTETIHQEQQIFEVPETKTLEEYIHSIEDKSKALNFVIGRVYSKFHGGNNIIREKLRIPSEWYNEFSLIGLDGGDIDKDTLMEIITKFELQLAKFEKTEFEVFKNKSTELKNLIRNPDGTDTIINVMDHNDKDPVRSYYEGATEFCKKIREEIEKDSLTLVKNEYIPKTPEEEAELKGIPTSSNFAEPKRKQKPETKKNTTEKNITPEEKEKKILKDDSDESPKPKFYHP